MSKLKVTITRAKVEEISEYPCLMQDNYGDIIFVTGSKDDGSLIGTIIHKDKNSLCSLGEYDTKWEPSYFKPFHGKITLEQ